MCFETIEYRPNTTLGFAFTALFIVTSPILVWVGSILGPDDVASMDGINLILFTVIPIRLFSWTAATVFAVFGLLIARRTLRAEPTLTISETGVTLPTGKVIQWSDVMSAEAKENELVLTVDGDRNTQRAHSIWPRWLGGGVDDNQVIMSSFALGADPACVEAELETRRVSCEERRGLTNR